MNSLDCITEIRLSDWQLCGFYPYVPFLGNSVETGKKLQGVINPVPAFVPGSIYADLHNAGLLPEIYKDMNSLSAEWVKDRWWLFRTSFIAPGDSGKRLQLYFGSVDYHCHIYLNNRKLCEHIGATVPIVLDIADNVLWGAENVLTVLIQSAPDEMGQIGYTDKTFTQRGRYDYKWDFSCRLVNLGMPKPVILREFEGAYIESFHFKTQRPASQGKAKLKLTVNSLREEQLTARATMSFEGKEVCSAENTFIVSSTRNETELDISVPDVQLWFPSGKGSPSLYDLSMQLIREGEEVYRQEKKVGFKDIEYIKNEDAPADSLSYTVKINGGKIYLKGFNITPLDMMSGTVGRERYERLVRDAYETGANILRVNGIGFIEDEAFYDACDRYGILVFQDFIQSSCGINNVPNTDEEYLKLVEKTALYAVREKRNHVCLTFWCGGNELSEDENDKPVTYSHPNIARIKTVTDKHDPQTLFLPSTPSGPRRNGEVSSPHLNHDVHGHWLYMGPEGHYEYYNGMQCQWLSEFGVNGMSCLASMKKFLSPQHLKVQSMTDSIVWRHHGEWWCSYERDCAIFGPIEDLDDFWKLSQFIQGEGIRYTIEAQRRRAYRQSGCMVWVLNEPYPNVSNTSVLDYYGERKYAYYTIMDAFCEVNASLKYDKLIYEAGEKISWELYVNSDLPRGDISTKVCVSYGGQNVFTGIFSASTGDGYAERAGNIEFICPRGNALLIEFETQAAGKTYRKRQLLLIRQADGFASGKEVAEFLTEIM